MLTEFHPYRVIKNWDGTYRIEDRYCQVVIDGIKCRNGAKCLVAALDEDYNKERDELGLGEEE